MPGKQRAKLLVLMLTPALAHIGALVAQMAHAQREEFALLVERQFGLGDGVARLRVGDEGLRTRRLPVHRPAELCAPPPAAPDIPDRPVVFMPKAPPTSSVMTRSFSVRHAHDGSAPGRAARRRSASRRAACSSRSPRRRCRWRRASPCEATTMRWLMTRTRATCGASAMISATSRSFSSLGTGPGQSTQRLPGASGYNCVRRPSSPSSRSTTGVSSSYSTCTRSAASCAAAWLSATTIATGSPTCITFSPPAPGGTASPSWRRRGPATGGWRADAADAGRLHVLRP